MSETLLTALQSEASEADALAAAAEISASLEKRWTLIRRLEEVGPPARSLLAESLFKQGVLLHKAGDLAGALDTLEAVVERFDDVVLPNKPYLAADALCLLCSYRFKAGQFEAAVQLADTLMVRYESGAASSLDVAEALWRKSQCLGWERLSRQSEELATLRQIIDEFAESTDPVVSRIAGLAMFQLGAVLRQRGQRREALEAWASLFEAHKNDPLPATQDLVARAQASTVETLAKTGARQKARSAAQRLVDCLASARTSDHAAALGKATIRSGIALEAAGDLEGAGMMFEHASRRLLDDDDAPTNALGVHALINLAVILGRQGKPDAAARTMDRVAGLGEPALTAFDELIANAGKPGSGVSSVREPWAMLMKALTLRELGREDEADAILSEIVAKFGNSKLEDVRLLVDAAANERRES